MDTLLAVAGPAPRNILQLIGLSNFGIFVKTLDIALVKPVVGRRRERAVVKTVFIGAEVEDGARKRKRKAARTSKGGRNRRI